VSVARQGESAHRWPFRAALLGTGVLTVGEFAARGIALLAVALLTRRLGPEGFGIVGFATAIAGYLAIAVNNGIGEVAARDVAMRPAESRDIYGAALAIRLGLGALAWIVIGVIAVLLPQPADTKLVVALTGLSFVSAAVDPSWAYKALGRPLASVGVLIAAQVLYATGVLFLVLDRSQVIRVPAVQFGAELAVAGLAGWLLAGRRLPHFDWRRGWSLLARARFLTASRIVRGLTVNFDMVLLGFTAATAQLGIYAASYRVLFLLMAVGLAIAGAFLPVLTRAASAEREVFRRTTSAAFTTALAVAVPLGFGGAAAAPDLLALLFGPAYVSGAAAFRLLMLAGACFIVHSALMYAFIASDRTRLLSGIHLAAAVLNVSLNLWGTPRYGIVAAGAATLAAEGVTALATVVTIGRDPGLSARLPLAIGVAGFAMTAAVIALGPGLPLGIRIAAGAAVYFLALVVLGGRQLREIVRNVVPAA
jgi:O-antigen/teichoic acid export membrane protein